MVTKIKTRKIMTGKDLESFAKEYNLTTIEACNALGVISPSRWFAAIKEDAELIPTMALLIRLYNKYPDLIPKEEEVDADDLLEQINYILGEDKLLTKSDYSLSLGRDYSAVTRWKNRNETPILPVRRLLQALAKIAYEEDKQRLLSYFRLVKEEEKVRGIDLQKEKTWKEEG